MDFADQVVVVTGGTGSIGRELVRALAAHRARVLFCYRQNEQAARELVTACGEADVYAQAADVRDQAQMNDLVALALERWGRFDVLITAHSATNNAPIAEMTLDQWNDVLQTLLRGTTRICRAAIRPMQRARYGRIVTVSGYQPLAGAIMQANYAAAMGGVLGFGKALAREVAPWNITVNSVAPGLIERPQLSAFAPAFIDWATDIVPFKRLGQPSEVVPAVLMLASPQASYISGETICVDGGWRMVG